MFLLTTPHAYCLPSDSSLRHFCDLADYSVASRLVSRLSSSIHIEDQKDYILYTFSLSPPFKDKKVGEKVREKEILEKESVQKLEKVPWRSPKVDGAWRSPRKVRNSSETQDFACFVVGVKWS